jgi:aminopeptidase
MANHEFAEQLERYAEVIVRVGVNLQPGQRVYMRAPLAAAPLARAVARAAYAAGAPFVDVIWNDEQITLARLQHAPRDSFDEFPQWFVDSALAAIERGDAFVSLVSDTPGLLAGQDQAAIAAMMQTAGRRSEPVGGQIQRNAVPWTVAAAANPGWAEKVFPAAEVDSREVMLWQAILSACRINRPDPVAEWKAHVGELAARASYMTGRRYTALRYRGPGTDLTLGLPVGHIWAGGGGASLGGQPFVANLPTEEIFTLGHRERADGVVRASRPLNLAGVLIEDFALTFKDGRVVEAHAARGEEVLRRTLDADEGAARLGEIALVPASSPIAASNVLFANTLYDENAASHLAVGRAYRFNLEGGTAMAEEQFQAAGGNFSTIHVDFMIGSAALDIDGVTPDGAGEPVMRAGEWAFKV